MNGKQPFSRRSRAGHLNSYLISLIWKRKPSNLQQNNHPQALQQVAHIDFATPGQLPFSTLPTCRPAPSEAPYMGGRMSFFVKTLLKSEKRWKLIKSFCAVFFSIILLFSSKNKKYM